MNHAIDEIRTTLIRQTMFAEFDAARPTNWWRRASRSRSTCFASEYRKLLEHLLRAPTS